AGVGSTRQGRIARGLDVSSGAGTGSALYWRIRTQNNKRIKTTSLVVFQSDGLFNGALPATSLKPSDTIVTFHGEMADLGRGSPVVYSRLFGFTQIGKSKARPGSISSSSSTLSMSV